MHSTPSLQYSLEDLCYLMERLRDPKTGCPWDIKQNFLSITPSTIEEAYEVVDAIEKGDRKAICEELGDLLFQVIFYSQLAKEEGAFDLPRVVDQLTAKLIRRHPHVFPDGSLNSVRESALDEQTIKQQWETIKAQERKNKGQQGVFEDIPEGLPASTRALKIQKRAAARTFDWDGYAPVFEKLQEEIAELHEAVEANNAAAVQDELGDVLFTVMNLARHLKTDPDAALRQANSKFVSRFDAMLESLTEQSQQLHHLSTAEKEALWQAVKQNDPPQSDLKKPS